MNRAIIYILILAIALAGAACAGPKVEVAKKGTYVYWFTYKDASGGDLSTLPQRFKGRSAELDASALGAKFTDAKLYIMDRKTGNAAIVDYVPAKDPKAEKPIKIGKDDLEYVRNVRLRIISKDGAPLESAIVSLTDGENTKMIALVTPADEGVAKFTNVASGTINVKVQADGLERTIDSDVELPEKRDAPGFERDIKVSGDVDTLPVPAKVEEKAKSKPAPAKPQPAGSIALSLVAGLILLAFIIGIVIVVAKSKGFTAAAALRKMGAQLPTDAGTAQAPAIDPNVCEFCGQRKRADGSCACSVSPDDSPFATPGPSAIGGPRLVGISGIYAGQVFDLKGGSAVIGREPTNSVPLPNDTTASRRHATISESGGAYTLRDEGSSNGTFLNGAKITEQRLTPGDEIQVGGTRFRFEI